MPYNCAVWLIQYYIWITIGGNGKDEREDMCKKRGKTNYW